MNRDEQALMARMFNTLEGGGELWGEVLRKWFAGRAVFWIARDVEKELGRFDPDVVAERALDFADRLITLADSREKERIKEKQTK